MPNSLELNVSPALLHTFAKHHLANDILRSIRNPLGAFRHKQDSTLVAEQATIFSTHLFLRVNM